jgi:FlaA1/EpsC-like NDP-sugar epimerase
MMPSWLPRLNRPSLAFFHDIVMAAGSFALSFYLRLGDEIYAYSPTLLVQGTVLFTVVAAAVFWFMGLYRGVWRYASLNDLVAIARSTTLAVLLFLLIMFLWTRLESLPRSLLVINWFILMAMLGGPRFLYRMIKDRRFEWRLGEEGQTRIPVLVVGSEDGAELFIRALARQHGANYSIAGIVSERQARVGQRIHGVEVVGTLDAIPEVVARLNELGERPQRLILTKDDIEGTTVRALLDTAEDLGMTLARLPHLTDFKSGIADKLEVKPVAIEDLLGRPQTPLDRDAMGRLIEGKRVLVTGAGGSIGGELVRQVADFSPAHLTLLDNSEFNLYAIDLELAGCRPDLSRHAQLGDVRDRDRVAQLIGEAAPDIVFHAAALKHVPLVETNVAEGVMTNVVGTVNVADACRQAATPLMVMVSTDKAVNPTSVMGATKRIAESYCQALDVERGNGEGTRFVTVRFGNVLGSTGSVVPLFQKQLAQGGPLTVTDPAMTRYFMTVREAVELILQASALGGTGARHEGKIFVLDMGEPVRILDLAKQVIRLAGLRPEVDIKIDIVGVRPGEKLAEEKFHGGEPLLETPCKGILLAAPRLTDGAELARDIGKLADAARRPDPREVSAMMRALVPEYDPWLPGASE